MNAISAFGGKRGKIVLVLFLCVVLAGACWVIWLERQPDREKAAQALISQADEASKNGDLKKSISLLTEAVQTRGLSGETYAIAYDHRGNDYDDMGQDEKALADYNESTRRDPNYAVVYYNLGLFYQRRGKSDEALKNYGEILKRNPSYAAAYINRGMTYYAMGDYAHAAGDFNKLLTYHPGSEMALNNLAHVNIAQGDYAEAIQNYSTILDSNPDSKIGLNGLAWAYATCPKPELLNGTKAVELAKKACDLTDWKDDNILLTMAAAEAEAGDFDAAVKYQQQAIDLIKAAHRNADRQERRLTLYQQKKPYRVGME